MPNNHGQLAKLTTRGMRLEPGSGGTGGLKWDDVAAGLRGLDDPAYFLQSMRLRAKRKHEREARSLATAGGHVNQLRAILRANLGSF